MPDNIKIGFILLISTVICFILFSGLILLDIQKINLIFDEAKDETNENKITFRQNIYLIIVMYFFAELFINISTNLLKFFGFILQYDDIQLLKPKIYIMVIFIICIILLNLIFKFYNEIISIIISINISIISTIQFKIRPNIIRHKYYFIIKPIKPIFRPIKYVLNLIKPLIYILLIVSFIFIVFVCSNRIFNFYKDAFEQEQNIINLIIYILYN